MFRVFSAQNESSNTAATAATAATTDITSYKMKTATTTMTRTGSSATTLYTSLSNRNTSERSSTRHTTSSINNNNKSTRSHSNDDLKQSSSSRKKKNLKRTPCSTFRAMRKKHAKRVYEAQVLLLLDLCRSNSNSNNNNNNKSGSSSSKSMTAILYEIDKILKNNPLVVHGMDAETGYNALHVLCTNPSLVHSTKIMKLLIRTSLSIPPDAEKSKSSSSKKKKNKDNNHKNTTGKKQQQQQVHLLQNTADVQNNGTAMVAKILVQRSLQQRGGGGETIFHVACSNYVQTRISVDVMEYLIACYPDGIQIPELHCTNLPLHTICIVASTEFVSLDMIIVLVQSYKDSCTIPNCDNNLPLHLIAEITSNDILNTVCSKQIRAIIENNNNNNNTKNNLKGNVTSSRTKRSGRRYQQRDNNNVPEDDNDDSFAVDSLQDIGLPDEEYYTDHEEGDDGNDDCHPDSFSKTSFTQQVRLPLAMMAEEERIERERQEERRYQNQLEIIQYLVHMYPAALHVKNDEGLTPLQIAVVSAARLDKFYHPDTRNNNSNSMSDDEDNDNPVKLNSDRINHWDPIIEFLMDPNTTIPSAEEEGNSNGSVDKRKNDDNNENNNKKNNKHTPAGFVDASGYEYDEKEFEDMYSSSPWNENGIFPDSEHKPVDTNQAEQIDTGRRGAFARQSSTLGIAQHTDTGPRGAFAGQDGTHSTRSIAQRARGGGVFGGGGFSTSRRGSLGRSLSRRSSIGNSLGNSGHVGRSQRFSNLEKTHCPIEIALQALGNASENDDPMSLNTGDDGESFQAMSSLLGSTDQRQPKQQTAFQKPKNNYYSFTSSMHSIGSYLTTSENTNDAKAEEENEILILLPSVSSEKAEIPKNNNNDNKSSSHNDLADNDSAEKYEYGYDEEQQKHQLFQHQQDSSHENEYLSDSDSGLLKKDSIHSTGLSISRNKEGEVSRHKMDQNRNDEHEENIHYSNTENNYESSSICSNSEKSQEQHQHCDCETERSLDCNFDSNDVIAGMMKSSHHTLGSQKQRRQQQEQHRRTSASRDEESSKNAMWKSGHDSMVSAVSFHSNACSAVSVFSNTCSESAASQHKEENSNEKECATTLIDHDLSSQTNSAHSIPNVIKKLGQHQKNVHENRTLSDCASGSQFEYNERISIRVSVHPPKCQLFDLDEELFDADDDSDEETTRADSNDDDSGSRFTNTLITPIHQFVVQQPVPQVATSSGRHLIDFDDTDNSE